MSQFLDEEALHNVSHIGTRPWSGETFPHTAPRRDPLSGRGARLLGGRWNPPGLFDTLYLANPVATCMGELERLAASQSVEVEDLIEAGRELHTIAIVDLPVLDLTVEAHRTAVGLTETDITGASRERCQAIGHAAWFLQFGGILAPSATGTGVVLAAFEARIDPGQVTLEESQPISIELYRQHCA